MAYEPTSAFAVGLDLEPICKPWTSTLNSSTDARMMNRAEAVKRVAQQLNHCLARYPRVMMQMNMLVTTAEAVGADPLYQWYYDDQVANGRTSTCRICMVKRTAGAGNAIAGRYTGGAITEKTSTFDANIAGAVLVYAGMKEASYQISRGADAAAEITESLSTENGYTVTGFSVQDDEITSLNTASHLYVIPSQANKGWEILADILEDIRDKFHDLQTSNLSKFINWSAQRTAATGWNAPAGGSGDEHGIAVIADGSGNMVNLLAQTIGARTGTSPGVQCHVRNRGWGATDETNGQLVKVQCRVHAEIPATVGTNDGFVRFWGPDHVANNYTDITVTNAAARTWWGNSGNYIYLDSRQADTVVTTARNKIDMFGWIDDTPARSDEVLDIYGLSAWQDSPPY